MQPQNPPNARYRSTVNVRKHRVHKLKRVMRSKRKGRKPARKRFATGPLLAFILIVLSLISVFVMKNLEKMQHIYSTLPPADEPFHPRNLASTMYDRNGTELYKIIGQEARDSVRISEVPEHVKWAFLAAEDIDFYNHAGFDVTAIARCAATFINSNGHSICGGSTITQQLIKMTTADYAFTVDRKLREILMAQIVENKYSKVQILEQYLTTVPMGSNLYGLTTGARFYFNKTPAELTIAEGALLAAIIQNPVALSPTLGLPDPVIAQQKALVRQKYILDQMEKHMDKINKQTRVNLNDEEIDDVLTPELIAQAKQEELHFQTPIFTDKKAGHVVDYATLLLTSRPYKPSGEPFTIKELQTQGYKIYTTIDYEVQKQLEESAADAMRTYAPIADAHNQAMILMNPRNGQILAMLGSKNYNAPSEGCDENGRNCLFNPQINVFTTKQSPGSSTKPFVMYEAYRTGKLFTGSLLPDIPITIGAYNPKNWNGTFHGVSTRTYAASMLCESRNLPAIIALQMVGLPRFLEVMRMFGYSTYPADWDFGPPVVLGGADVIGIEHAQAYSVLANDGKFNRHEIIEKIVDRDGNVIYQHTPQSQQVADRRAVYMVNYSLLNCYGSSWDGRQVASKTGTSEDSTDAWEITYTPDLVVVGWMGNNNNRPMNSSGFGGVIVLPWMKDFMRRVGDSQYFSARTDFPQPEGLIWSGGESVNGAQTGMSPGLMLDNNIPEPDIFYRTAWVCKDQPNRIARPIDFETGHAIQINVMYYKMPAREWQYFLDAYLAGIGQPNGGPSQSCDLSRNKPAPPAPPPPPPPTPPVPPPLPSTP